MATQQAWTQASLKARALVAQGILSEVPAWLQVLERFGAFEPKKGKSPKQIHFAEDKLYQAYMANHPQFLQQPLDLNSERPSAMKLFVMTQAALMEQGHSQRAAYKLVEEEFRKSASTQVMSAGQLTLAAAQKQEERLLQAALKQRREEVGPPPELIAAAPPETPPRAFSFRLPPKPQAAQDQQSSPATVQSGTSASPEAATSAVNQQSSAQSISPSGSQRGKQRQQRASPESSPKQAPTAPAGFVPFTSDNY